MDIKQMRQEAENPPYALSSDYTKQQSNPSQQKWQKAKNDEDVSFNVFN